MSEDFVKSVKNLLASGKGDPSRFREILESVRQGNPVYMSDYKYVQSMLSVESGTTAKETGDLAREAKLEDPIGILRIRLAEGRITVDQFRDLKKTILEF